MKVLGCSSGCSPCLHRKCFCLVLLKHCLLGNPFMTSLRGVMKSNMAAECGRLGILKFGSSLIIIILSAKHKNVD